MARPLRIALVAGEASGDLLGAALIQALRVVCPQASFQGVAGPRMLAEGCQAIGSTEELSVMGFVEPLRHLPRLLRLRSRLLRRWTEERPDVFIGIDSPAFNLGLARKLKRVGIPTVQYVSPQVWAWRQGRVKSMGTAVDLVLCLLPFEAAFYARHAVRAEFVGHPLADQIPLEVDQAAARTALHLPSGGRVVAVLPGSRLGEVERLGADFAAATVALAGRYAPALAPSFIAPMASAAVREVFQRQVARTGARIELVDGHSRDALVASDAVLVASGTATLETLLCQRPMVVAYRVAPLTAFIARELGLVKVRYVSQPNLLAEEPLVPELLQEAVTPAALADALYEQLEDGANREALQRRFQAIHQQLRLGGARRAAEAILALLAARSAA